MLAALLLAGMYADWTPARWPSNDPRSLELLDRTPVNCLWLERPLWSEAFAATAAKRGIATLGVIRAGEDPVAAANALARLGFTGAVLEGDPAARDLASAAATLAKSRLLTIECAASGTPRSIRNAPILAVCDGAWPGIRIGDERGLEAGPTSAPWIDSNAGLIRRARASTDATIWIANRPPPKLAVTSQQYIQAVGDAAMNGARWVLAFDNEFWSRLLARDAKALDQWRQIAAGLQHYEDRREWRGAGARGGIAVIAGEADGGLLEMLASRNLPVFPLSPRALVSPDLRGALLAVNSDPAALAPRQSQMLAEFAKAGGIVIDGPGKLVDIWQKVEAVTSERNMGVRLYNVSSVRSNLLTMPGQRQMLLHLVNYSGYPVQGISIRVLGVYRHARIFRPGKPAMDVDGYKSEEGTGFDIEDAIGAIATVVME